MSTQNKQQAEAVSTTEAAMDMEESQSLLPQSQSIDDEESSQVFPPPLPRRKRQKVMSSDDEDDGKTDVDKEKEKITKSCPPRLLFTTSQLEAIERQSWPNQKKKTTKKANKFWPKKKTFFERNYQINRRLLWPKSFHLGGSYVFDVRTADLNGYIYSAPSITKRKLSDGEPFSFNFKRDDILPLKNLLTCFLMKLIEGMTKDEKGNITGYSLPEFDQKVDGSASNLYLCAYRHPMQGDVIGNYLFI